MPHVTKIFTACALLRAKVSNKRWPLFVSWMITDQCNYACAYCNPAQKQSREVSTEEAFSLLDDLALLGTRKISFTGGEPFLRQDLGAIIHYCGKKGIVTSINSNGSLVPARIDEVRGISVLNLSLDGPQDIHDFIRGKGSFVDVMKAADAAKSRGIKAAFSVTLSKLNLGCLAFFLKTARDRQSFVYFQPGEANALRGGGLNPYVHPEDKYRIFIKEVLAAKKDNRFIGNSTSGLQHLMRWPVPHPSIRCHGGRLFCRIDANGDVKICPRTRGSRIGGNILDGGFKQAFERIEQVACDHCWCAQRVEFNYALNGHWPAILNAARIG